MEEILLYLTYVVVILLIGLFCSTISNKLKIPNVLLLILSGMALALIKLEGKTMAFSPIFLAAIAIFALAMIVFTSTSKLRFKEFDTLSIKAMKMTGLAFILNMIIITFAAKFLMNISYLLALVFAALMVGTAPDIVLIGLKKTGHKVVELLKIESIINTPLIVLIPFIIIEAFQVTGEKLTFFLGQFIPILQQIVAGIGAGIVVGLIVFRVMRKYYSASLSPIAIIAAALLTYILAENLGGNGVLAVTTIGLFFANVHIKHKIELREFSSFMTNFLEIFVFVLIGLMIVLPLTAKFFVTSLSLFAFVLVLRYFSIQISFRKEFNLKEKFFMTLNSPKGIGVAVVIFILATQGITDIATLSSYTLALILYSIIISTAAMKFSKFFIKEEVIKKG